MIVKINFVDSSAAATQQMNSKSDGEGGEMDSYLNLNDNDFEALARLEGMFVNRYLYLNTIIILFAFFSFVLLFYSHSLHFR